VTEPDALSDRQRNELEYHRQHAENNARLAKQPPSLDVATTPRRRWWNAYWSTYSLLRQLSPRPRRALVVGCGFGDDAIRVAALADKVSAFDLSPDSLTIARARWGLVPGLSPVEFRVMPSERLDYSNGTFDLILAVDILHHVDIPRTIVELNRVAADGCIVVCDEVYTHSILERIRRSTFVERVLYPRLRSWVYGSDRPYITPDERKLDEHEVALLQEWLKDFRARYYNLFIGRLIPDRFDLLARLDRATLAVLGPLGRLCGARVVMSGFVRKSADVRRDA
jgi:ubiquinone/menaquinone biosynthesis C-methylase UbiE